MKRTILIVLAALFYAGVRTKRIRLNALLLPKDAVTGVDISRYQGDVDMAVLKEQGVQFIYIKATEGVGHTDERFAENWAHAKEAGLARGAYHFFRTSKDPLLQAQNFISAVTLTHADLPPVLDVETIHSGCTPEELNRKALTWLKTVEAHYGRKPMVYTNDKFALDILSEDITGHYPLWIARYNSAPPRTSGWSRWQFSDKAVVYGIRGYVDLSVIQK